MNTCITLTIFEMNVFQKEITNFKIRTSIINNWDCILVSRIIISKYMLNDVISLDFIKSKGDISFYMKIHGIY